MDSAIKVISYKRQSVDNILSNPNNFEADREVISAIISSEQPYIPESFFTTSTINDGSFLLPLYGTGGRKGESVSKTILSNGISLSESVSEDFL